jgi:hypothetical protein
MQRLAAAGIADKPIIRHGLARSLQFEGSVSNGNESSAGNPDSGRSSERSLARPALAVTPFCRS